jgi:hypothetical protein
MEERSQNNGKQQTVKVFLNHKLKHGSLQSETNAKSKQWI